MTAGTWVYSRRRPRIIGTAGLTSDMLVATLPVMAYLRISKVGKAHYYYIMKSIRRGKKVSGKVLEYLGRDPDPKRLRRALAYWGVKAKSEDD